MRVLHDGARALLLLAALAAGCTSEVDGEVGSTTMSVANESDRALTFTHESGDLGEPQVLATEIPAGRTTPILRSSGCFGCSDPPERAVPRLTLRRADDDAVVVDLNPAVASDWTRAPDEEGDGTYSARYTFTVTQAMVDGATP